MKKRKKQINIGSQTLDFLTILCYLALISRKSVFLEHGIKQQQLVMTFFKESLITGSYQPNQST